MVLNRHEVFEADRVGLAGNESSMERKAVTAVNGRVSRTWIVREPVEAQLIHGLEVPFQGTLGAIHGERILTLRSNHGSTRLECSGRSIGERAQHRSKVLIFHFALRVIRSSSTVVTGGSLGDWPMGNGVVLHTRDLGDRADEELRHGHRVTEDVAGDSIARLIHKETPREQAQLVAPVHRQEVPAVVRDVAELT